MPSFIDIPTGKTPAAAADIQQVIDALKGTVGKGIPLSPTAVADAIAYALSVKNTDATSSRAGIFYGADGNPLLSIDKNGVQASAYGANALAPVATTTATQTLTNKTLTAPHMTGAVVDSGGLVAATSDLTGKRVRTAGSGLVTGDFSLGAGWGSTGSVTSIATGSNDLRGQISIVPSGTGIVANPTITLTFHDGTFTSIPFIVASIIDSTGVSAPLGIALSATQLTLTFYATPVSARGYTLTWVGLG